MATKKLRPLLLLEPLPGGLSLLAGFKVMAFPFCTKILALIGNGFELVFGKVFLRARPFESKMLSAMENETWKESDGNKRKKKTCYLETPVILSLDSRRKTAACM